MTEKTNLLLKKILYVVGITLLVYVSIRFALPMVFPFLFAYLIAFALHRIVKRLHDILHLPRGIVSIAVIAFFTAAVLVPIGFLLYKGVCEFGLLLSNYPELARQADVLWCGCCQRLEEISGVDAAMIEDFGRKNAIQLVENAKSDIVPCIMNYSMISLKAGAVFLGKAVITLVAAVLILNDYERLNQWVKKSELYSYVDTFCANMRKAGGTYIKAELMVIGLVCLTCIAGLFIAGNPYAILVGVLIGLCDALPFIGTGMIFVPWLIIEILRGAYVHALIYGFIYIACTFIREYVEPKLVGKGLGVHPLAIIISIYIGLKVYGIAGVVLGPLSAFLIYEICKK